MTMIIVQLRLYSSSGKPLKLPSTINSPDRISLVFLALLLLT